MQTALYVIAIAVAVWIILMLLLKGGARLMRRSTLKAMNSMLAYENILLITDNAGYMGADFPGPNLPPRTNGVLALTSGKLIFLPLFPRKAITLPAQWIKGVGARQTFNDISYNIPFLVVDVRDLGDPDGQIAWIVNDPEEWVRKIKEVGSRV
jgi:hypothetical protein